MPCYIVAQENPRDKIQNDVENLNLILFLVLCIRFLKKY
jgi:hypothetical protein